MKDFLIFLQYETFRTLFHHISFSFYDDLTRSFFSVDSESEEELEPLFIPDVPNNILWLKYTEDKTIWLSMAG